MATSKQNNKQSSGKRGKGPQAVPKEERIPHHFLAEDLLVPNVDKIDGARLNMFISHSAQLLTLDKPELPRVFTRFENQIGSYSHGTGYRKLREDATFAGSVEMGESEKYLFFIYEDNTVDIVTHRSTTRLTEDYGHVNHYRFGDVEPGTEVEKGTVIDSAPMFDESGNVCYGVNLKAIFLAMKGLTFEDGIILSESGAKKFTHTSVSEAVVSLNNNDILVNRYGTKASYKPFPNVGEEIEEGILCARRRVDYNTVYTDFKDGSNEVDHVRDTVFYFDGVVEGIEVFTNLSDDELNQPHNAAVKAIVDNRRGLYQDLLETIKEFEDEGYTLRPDAAYLKQRSIDFLSGKKFSHDRSEFEGTILKFTIRKTHNINIGSKITGRYGNKGTISKIIPDDEMPRTEDGRIPDVVLNTLGVYGRLNPAQNYEHELTYIADEILRERPGDALNAVMRSLELLQIVSPTQYDFLIENMGDKKQTKQFGQDIINNGLQIHQPPFFGNCSFEALQTAYKHFNTKLTKFVGVERPLVFGTMYFIQLRHEPISKFSARSAGQVGLLDVPFKSNEQYKKGTARFNSNPVRFGEQELFNFLLLANVEDGSKRIVEFIRSYSSHNRDRKNMLAQMLQRDPEDLDFVFCEGDEAVTSAAQIIRSFFAGMGVNMTSDDAEEVIDALNEDEEEEAEA
jgi:DNA-directed RNA polymerase beta subunit